MDEFGFTNDQAYLEAAIAWKDAAVADEWECTKLYNTEPITRACTLSRDGFNASILLREGGIGPKYKYQVSINIWGPDSLCIIPPRTYDWTAIQAGLTTCNYCRKTGVPTERVAFAGRACKECAPKEWAKLPRNWSA